MKTRFSEEQIIGFLKQADASMAVKDLCRKHGCFERICGVCHRDDLARLPMLARTDPSTDELPHLDVAIAHVGQGNIGIGTKRNPLLLPATGT